MYFCTSFSTAEAAQIQPPLRIFDPAARARAAAATLSSAFGTAAPLPGQPEFNQATAALGKPHKVLLQSTQVSPMARGDLGRAGSENEVMRRGTIEPPHTHPELHRAPRLPDICRPTDAAAGSCSLSLDLLP